MCKPRLCVRRGWKQPACAHARETEKQRGPHGTPRAPARLPLSPTSPPLIIHHHAHSTHTGKEAGGAYEKLAEVQTKLDAKHEAASACVEAAKCYQKTDRAGTGDEEEEEGGQGGASLLSGGSSAKQTPDRSFPLLLTLSHLSLSLDVLRALHSAVGHYTDIGRLGMAARSLRDVAETMEKGGLKEEAIEFFTQAGDLYAGEEQPSEANKCRLRVAALSAEVERYAPAAAIFEEVGAAAVDNPLLKYGAKGHFLNAGICVLAAHGGDDPVAVGAALDRYEAADGSLAGSREGDLLRALAAAAAGRDPDAFTSALAEFDAMTRLDAWKTALLLRVKKRIAGGGAAEGGEEDLT